MKLFAFLLAAAAVFGGTIWYMHNECEKTDTCTGHDTGVKAALLAVRSFGQNRDNVDYGSFCTEPKVVQVLGRLKGDVYCKDSASSFTAFAKLDDGTYWCVDLFNTGIVTRMGGQDGVECKR